jgi:cytoskeleton protein RodZ
MSETQIPAVEQQNPADDRPGHRLAEARKAKGLSLEEVASQLRLNVSMLQALENDDYSHLPPAAYVSGYVRSYARALGLTEAEVLRSHATAPSGEPPIVGVVARSHTAQVPGNDPRVKLVSGLIIGGFLIISGAWWVVQSEDSVLPPAPEQTAALPPPDSGAVPAAPGAEVPAPAAVAPAVTAPASVPAMGAATMPARPAPVTPAPVPAAKPAPAAPAAATPPVAEAPKPAAPPPPPLTADVLQSKVVLEFSADCWVDVVDAAGRQLAYELAPAGRKIRLRGEAPFTVFFGYSPGVQVTFNDQPYDHRPFQRKDVARFKLGTAEDNTQQTEAQ